MATGGSWLFLGGSRNSQDVKRGICRQQAADGRMVLRGSGGERQLAGLQRFVADVGDEAVVTMAPSMQGRTMSIILGPNKTKP